MRRASQNDSACKKARRGGARFGAPDGSPGGALGDDRRDAFHVAYRDFTPVQSLQIFQIVTAAAHAGQAAAIGALVFKYKATKSWPVYIPFVTWPDPDATPCLKHFGYERYKDGSVDVGACIFAFFLLSFTFQFIAAVPLWNKYIDLLLDRYVQPFRWCGSGAARSSRQPHARARRIEYSISASIMVIIYALLSGVQETTFLYNMFISFFVVMMLGLLQEIGMSAYKRREWEMQRLYQEYGFMPSLYAATVDDDGNAVGKPAYNERVARSPVETLVLFLPHLLGWVVFVGVVSVFVVSFFLSTTQPGKPKPPGWVYGLYISQFLIMGGFAWVQLTEQALILRAKTDAACKRLAVRAEVAYTVLSLAAKSVLCWVLFSELLVEKTIDYAAPLSCAPLSG